MIATPFKGGMDCWNGGDWMIIISPVCLFVLAILLFFIQRQIKNKEKMLRKRMLKGQRMLKGLGRK